VEVDGEVHLSRKEYDIGRTAEMDKYGIKVIRFSNLEVERNLDEVIRRIESEIRSRI
jgi:very-short-patch-repair endonuclease